MMPYSTFCFYFNKISTSVYCTLCTVIVIFIPTMSQLVTTALYRVFNNPTGDFKTPVNRAFIQLKNIENINMYERKESSNIYVERTCQLREATLFLVHN